MRGYKLTSMWIPCSLVPLIQVVELKWVLKQCL